MTRIAEGGNQRGEGPPGRHHARGESLVVALAEHFGNRHAGEDRGGGDRRAGDRRESRAREDRRHREPAGDPGDPALRAFEQGAGESGVVGEVADQDEGRDQAQRVGADLGVGHLARDLDADFDGLAESAGIVVESVPAQPDQPDKPRQPGGEGDPHAKRDEDDHPGGGRDADAGCVHQPGPSSSAAAERAWSSTDCGSGTPTGRASPAPSACA